jgi:hypothetical protein
VTPPLLSPHVPIEDVHSDAPRPGGKFQIKYVRLEKGTYVKLQPKTAGLSQIPGLKATLEMNLRHHATLTEGDLLPVWFRGKCYDVKVRAWQLLSLMATTVTVVQASPALLLSQLRDTDVLTTSLASRSSAQVVKLEPDPKVTVIDTDIEVDLDLPENHPNATASTNAAPQPPRGSPLMGTPERPAKGCVPLNTQGMSASRAESSPTKAQHGTPSIPRSVT